MATAYLALPFMGNPNSLAFSNSVVEKVKKET